MEPDKEEASVVVEEAVVVKEVVKEEQGAGSVVVGNCENGTKGDKGMVLGEGTVEGTILDIMLVSDDALKDSTPVGAFPATKRLADGEEEDIVPGQAPGDSTVVTTDS